MANPVTHRFVACHDKLKLDGTVKSSRQFALAIDTRPQSLNEILKGKRDATVANIMKLAEVFDVNEAYLLSGSEPMFKSEIATVELREDKIKYLPTPAYAGYMDQFQEHVTDEDIETFSIPGYQDMYGEHRCFDVAGDSMEPTFFAGDKIVCSQVPSSHNYNCIKDKYVYVVITTTDIMVKRVINNIAQDGTITLKSDNDFYEDVHLPVAEVREVWRVNLKLSQFMPDPANVRNSLHSHIKSLESTIHSQAACIDSLRESVESLRGSLSS